MKRKAEGGATQPSRRQPQVSCDSCRRKKLKCDRGQPCGSCHIRGIACTTPSSAPGTSTRDDHVHGPTSAAAAESDATIKSLLARVAALEQTVYRGGAASSSHPTPAASNASSYSPPSPPSALYNERRQEAKFLDSAIDRSKWVDQAGAQTVTDFRIATSQQPSHTVSQDSSTKYQISSSGSVSGQQGPTWLMSREEALALFHDFVDNAYHLLHILQMDAIRLIINQFYDQIESDLTASVSPDHAALILGIAATTAFFWDARVPCQHTFESEKAAKKSLSDLAPLRTRLAGLSLEAAQAYAIIAYLYYNVDGQSAQFRFLHASSIATCRELSMHLVDGPGGSDDDAATREVKRRLWWHVAATDWMLAQCGGPLDGTYTIHPRHMSVAKPRNLNDSDLSLAGDGLTHPPEVPTQMSCFLQRIRLAEACRAVVDGYLPGQAEISDYGQVLALDQLFEQILVTSPPCLALHAPVPPGAPRLLCLQRATVHLGFHSRRARLHRPFLMRKDADGRPGDTRFHQSREICIQSARTVLEISMALLEKSLSEPPDLEQQRMPHILNHANHEQCPGSPVHRLGIVINHLFTACAILALDSSVRTNRAGAQNNENADGDVQDALTCACRLLAAAGKESPVAADLVRGLTGVLRRYRIKVKGVEKWAEGSGPELQDAEEGRTSRNDVGQAEDPSCLESDVGPGHGLQPVENDAVENFGLDNLWDDFLGSELMSDDWEQIVTGLDSYYMPQFG
ncbi:putative Zn(II)2Cys6 transcription factor [Apiospora hydei]|uniref:Zn(II)2Cys6 transcription factor n=1 Tax=Apiospora hydei TaxID=1337664 RepID=A0ABR1X526_9PEZI